DSFWPFRVWPSARQARRREGCHGLRARRSGWAGDDLACAFVRLGIDRRHADWLGLFARLSQSWSPDDSPRAPHSRGLAMGAYTAFLDLSLGLASPALRLVG